MSGILRRFFFSKNLNVLEFYKHKEHLLYITSSFQDLLEQATIDIETTDTKEARSYYEEDLIADNHDWLELKGDPTDLKAPEGRTKARKCFGSVAAFLKKEPRIKGYQPNAYLLGWFKTISGSVRNAFITWDEDAKKWNCLSYLHEEVCN